MKTKFGHLDALAIWGLIPSVMMGRHFGPRFKTPEEEAAEKAAASGGGNEGGEKKEELVPQSKVNDMLANEKKKLAEEHKRTVDDLLKSKNLTEKERKDLEVKSKNLSEQLKSKEQQIEDERRETIAKHSEELGAEKTEKEMWKGEFTRTVVERDITEAAAKHHAKNPAQIRKMLSGECKLVQRTKKDGTPLAGKYDVMIEHEVEDAKTGEKKTKLMTIEQKVAAMAGSEEDENLFMSDRRGGSGQRSTDGSGGSGDGDAPSYVKIGRAMQRRIAGQ